MKWYCSMKTIIYFFLLLTWMPSITYAATGISLKVTHHQNIQCISEERETLLQIKQGIQSDNCGLFTSWDDNGQSNCCQWQGVRCNNSSGHVINLDLSSPAFWPPRKCLEGPIPEAISKLKHLEIMDLSANNFQGSIPEGIGDLCSLQKLVLESNNLTDELSNIIHALSGCAHKSLLDLYLSRNHIWGSIPDEISKFSSLKNLHLSLNKLNGTISQNLGQLFMLETLNLFSCSLKGTLSKYHLLNLSRFSDFDISDNPDLVVNISDDWVPPFQIDGIFMASCKLGPSFPKWLLNQKKISSIDLSNTGIIDTLPISFWGLFSSKLMALNMSHNSIYGVLPNPSMTFHSNYLIDFSSNQLEGPIPSFVGNLSVLLLYDNMFSNSMALLCPKAKMFVSYLDLSNNLLSGQLPDCWEDIHDELLTLRLANNRFTGKLPNSIGTLKFIEELYMRNNSFIGEVPKSFVNFTSLLLLDLGYNSLTGYVPPAIGNLRSLRILNLRSNKLNGILPLSFCQLSYLQVLDLSFNHISGVIPKCIHNLTAMVNASNFLPYELYYSVFFSFHNDSAMLMWKGKEQSFHNALGLVKYIAISDNQLHGQIPSGISYLRGLGALDLARNNLTGTIPSRIGQLASLQLLDLSSNHLSGEIPVSLAIVSFLEILDLSNNTLFGRIPHGTQLQGFDPAAYMGNPGLCGPPLSKCLEDVPSSKSPKGADFIEEEENESVDILLGFYVSALLGFIVGFWGVFGSLVLKRSWRHAYFRFLGDMKDKLQVIVDVNIARVWRRP